MSDNENGDKDGGKDDNKENGTKKRKRVQWTFEKVLKTQQKVDNELQDKWSKHKEYEGDNKNDFGLCLIL